MKKLLNNLTFWVIVAIALGVIFGAFVPNLAKSMEPLGLAFIKLVKMLIAPIIFCTIVSGIAGIGDTKKFGSVGAKSIGFFLILTALGAIIGLITVNIFNTADGLTYTVTADDISKAHAFASKSEVHSGGDFLLKIIPDNAIGAFANGDLLQVLVFSILFGLAVMKIGEKADPFIKGLKSLEAGLFDVIRIIMKLAPIGVFGAISFVIGKYGLASLVPLGKFVVLFLSTCTFFILIILGLLFKAFGFNIFKLIAYLKEEMLIVLGTSSSEATLPSLMEKLEKIGCTRPVVGLVIPTGFSFNLVGTSIYLTLAAVFLAQVTHTPLDIPAQINLCLLLLVMSKGAAGVAGAGLVVLAAGLPDTGHIPLGSVSIIVGIDCFMSRGRSFTNLIGNAIATILIARWENEIDLEKSKEILG
jgi:aerobic C4-dicarboxylate transport protein